MENANIFEPWDFEIRFSDRAGQALLIRGSSHGCLETLSSEFGEQVTAQANAKLSSLGIDAETCNKYEWIISQLRERLTELERVIEEKGNRLDLWERIIAEAPEVRGYMLGKTFYPHCVHSVIYEHSITHRARLIQIEPI